MFVNYAIDIRVIFGQSRYMLARQYNDLQYRKRQSEITKEGWKNGIYNSLRKSEQRECKNPTCNNVFQAKPHDKKLYCSSRCAATINNSRRLRKISFCVTCNNRLKRSDRKYCTVDCQWQLYYKQYVDRWKQGLEDGNIGITTRFVSHHIKRYLKEKYNNKCATCGWNQKNLVTDVVPLEINHIDGNSENNLEDNLELICPNCHALTSNFRNLNKGKGRAWRLQYIATHTKL